MNIDITKLKTSWTKFDIVRTLEVVYDIETIEKFKTKEAPIDEPVLRAFLGVKKLSDPTPEFWYEIQQFPKEKGLFALLATIFTHYYIIEEFANDFSTGDMKGTFFIKDGHKQYTNIRSCLVESGAASPIYRKMKQVPYDLSIILTNNQVGKIFKKLLLQRISSITDEKLTNKEFYEICFKYNFHKAISLNKTQFEKWLEGENFKSSRETPSYIDKAEIKNFYAINEVYLDFNESKEVYFLGENGDGKSLILMALYLTFRGNFITERTEKEKTGRISDIIRENIKLVLKGTDSRDNEYDIKKNLYLNNIYAYGTHRGRTDSDNYEQYGFMSLFSSKEELINPETWLQKQKLIELESNKSDHKTNLNKSISELENIFMELLEKNVEVQVNGNGVKFIEKGRSLEFEQLSEGYKSIIIFVVDLLYRLSNSEFRNKKDIFQSTAVVLVDEIELHLHPKWQRVLIGKLRTIFPNIQFIFTTHSPTIIQGAGEDAIIYRVYRNKDDGMTKVSDPYFRKNLDHLMVNTLVTSPLFDLEDSRMDTNNEDSDTSENYLMYKIYNQVSLRLESRKEKEGSFLTDEEIDNLISDVLDNYEKDK